MAESLKIICDGEVLEVDWINHDGRAWLVPTWILSPDGKMQTPLRIIAPRFAPGYDPIPGPDVLQFFQKIPVPKSLLDKGLIPKELKQLVEVRENPGIWFRNPKASH